MTAGFIAPSSIGGGSGTRVADACPGRPLPDIGVTTSVPRITPAISESEARRSSPRGTPMARVCSLVTPRGFDLWPPASHPRGLPDGGRPLLLPRSPIYGRLTLTGDEGRHLARTGRPVTIVSGTEPGSRGGSLPGVDELAILEVRRLGLPTIVHPADWQALGRKAGPLRNSTIVADAGHLVAFWNLRSRGTADAIDKAFGAGTLAKCYGPAGDEVPIEVVGDAVRAVLG